MNHNNENTLPGTVCKEGLHRKTLKGGSWVFALRISRLCLEALKLVILARLLTEKEFGLMGLALLLTGMFERVTETGFQSALIQGKEIDRQFLDSAWTVGVLRGIVLFIAVWVIAPWAADFFKTDQATPIIRAYGAILLIRGISNIGIVTFRKELEFNKQYLYQVSGIIVDVFAAITIACFYRTVWALVIGALAGEIVRAIASYIIHPYRPHLKFHRREGAQLFRFGKWVFGSEVLGYFLTHGDDIFVGRILGTAFLGFYQMAYRFSNMPSTEISSVIAQVTFPAYSKLQNNIPNLRLAYLKVLHLTSLLSFPIAMILFMLSREFVTIFLGQTWLEIIPAVKILAFYGLLGSIGGTTGVVFMAVGRPEIATKIKVGQLFLLAVLIYPLTSRWGIAGTSMTVTIEAGLFVAIAFWRVLKLLQFDAARPLKLLALPFTASLIMIVIIAALKAYVFFNVGIIGFVFLVMTAVVSYISLVIMFDKWFKWGTWKLVAEQISVLSGKSGKG